MAHRTPARRVRAASCAVLVAGLGVTLAGCGNGVESSTGTAPATTVSVTPTPTPATSPSEDSSAEPSGSTSDDTASGSSGSSDDASGGSSGTGICSADDLKVSESSPAGGGSAGGVYTVLVFANTSSSTCVLDGHPGVSFVGKGSGTQLGRGATFTGPTKRTTLAPGAQARAQLRIASPGVYGDSCAPVAADGFRIYPPDSRASVFVRESSYRACSKRLPGGKSQLSVTAVGTTQ